MMKYTYEEAVEHSTAYFNGEEMSAVNWVNKYALKDSAGNIYELTPTDMHWRLAKEIHRIEQKYVNPIDLQTIFDVLDNFKYIVPQGSPMAGIGNNLQLVSLSNCFVIGHNGLADSYGAILLTDQEQVQLMKRRGGVGHDLGKIRPAGFNVDNSALTSTGVVPFMERYSNTTREVAQDGRRGALMLSLSIHHPDIESFINAKLEQGKVTGANISVKITDEFMKAVIAKREYTQQYPLLEDLYLYNNEYETYINKVDAKTIWDKIIYNAWKSAEPGVLFIDKIKEESLGDRYEAFGFKTISTNPCGEIPLPKNDSCRLILINLYSYVIEPFTKNAYFDIDLFKKHSSLITRIMDNIIDLELEKIDAILNKLKNNDEEDYAIKRIEIDLWEDIKTKCINGRRTGIGVTGEGDMLAALGLTYGTPSATNFAEYIHRLYAIEVLRESVNLAKERGAFPIYNPLLEENHPFLNRIAIHDNKLIEDMKIHGRRHIAMLTMAPAGTVSQMTLTTSGGENVFLIAYKRRRKVNANDKNVKVAYTDELGDTWEEYTVFHHKFKDYLTANGYNVNEVEQLDEASLNAIIAKSPYHKATANEVDWVEKVKMQGAIQKWIDHSISVTVNVPEHTSIETINDIYLTAWQYGCKGCTIYRDKSRSGVLVSRDDTGSKSAFSENNAPKRPKTLQCKVYTFQNKGEKWVAVIGLYENKPYEIFTGKHSDFQIPSYVTSGEVTRHKVNNESMYSFDYIDKNNETCTIPNLNSAFNEQFYDMAKTISAILRHGMPLQYVVELIDGLNLDGDLINTWKVGVKRALKTFIKDGTVATNKVAEDCPQPENKNCMLVYEEGCLNCKTCGKSKCS